jgi:hypothetical protein
MIDITKLKGRRGQGSALAASPPPADRIELADVPETAPAEASKPQPKVAAPSRKAVEAERIDGRSLRRSSRVVQFATRVTPEFDREIRTIAQREGLMIVEVLERALLAYKKISDR